MNIFQTVESKLRTDLQIFYYIRKQPNAYVVISEKAYNYESVEKYDRIYLKGTSLKYQSEIYVIFFFGKKCTVVLNFQKFQSFYQEFDRNLIGSIHFLLSKNLRLV